MDLSWVIGMVKQQWFGPFGCQDGGFGGDSITFWADFPSQLKYHSLATCCDKLATNPVGVTHPIIFLMALYIAFFFSANLIFVLFLSLSLPSRSHTNTTQIHQFDHHINGPISSIAQTNHENNTSCHSRCLWKSYMQVYLHRCISPLQQARSQDVKSTSADIHFTIDAESMSIQQKQRSTSRIFVCLWINILHRSVFDIHCINGAAHLKLRICSSWMKKLFGVNSKS